jgi:hypothetical protein
MIAVAKAVRIFGFVFSRLDFKPSATLDFSQPFGFFVAITQYRQAF